jgi:hypothetical protein
VPKHTVPDLKELFKQAAEIAKEVPEVMQVAAFNRAIDLLTGATTTPAPSVVEKRTEHHARTSSRPSTVERTAGNLEQLMEKIDSTEHPGVRALLRC